MIVLDPNEFHRAFVLHPRAWREQNEAVAVSVLMDVAESSGRAQLTLSERASIYSHAASVWAERIVSRPIRNMVASLALGSGIAVAAVYLATFVVAPVVGQEFILASRASTGVLLVIPWVLAGFLAISGHVRATRWVTGFALIVCLAVGAMRLWRPELFLPSTLTLLFFSLSAALAMLGRPRWSLTWKALIVVGLSVAAVAVGSDLIGSSADWRLWMQLSYFQIFALSGLFLCLLSAAACGRSSVALAGTIYAAPWAALLIAGALRNGVSTMTIVSMILVWVCASAAIVGTLRLRGPHRRRSTYATTDEP